MKFNRAITILLLLTYCFLYGCGDGISEESIPHRGNGEADAAAGDSGGPRPGGRLVIGMQQEPEILNEALNSMVSVVYISNLIFSKFVKHNEEMELVCDLITEIPTVENNGISKDHLTYIYHIRKDAKWHDGKPVISRDVEFTWRLMIHPDVNVETTQGWDIVERVETPDSHTVVFHLSELYSNFVGDCFYDESVLPSHLLESKLGADFQSIDFHMQPVGSGPFIFHEWIPGSHIVLKANHGYYGEGPYLEEIVVKFVPDGNALLMQLETGSIMAIDNAPNSLVGLLRDLNDVKLYKNPALFNEHLDLNMENEILADRNVRTSLALAIDRREISEKIYSGIWVPAYSDEHPNSPYHNTVWKERIEYNPGRARKLLERSGWIDRDGDGIREKGGKGLVLSISTTAGRMNRERTEVVLIEQLQRVGIGLEIRNYHPTVLFSSYDAGGILKRGKFDIALYAFLAPPDPSTKEGSYSMNFIPPAGQNYSRIKNRELTRLLSRGSRTFDFQHRKAIYDSAAVILAEELPIVPLLWVTQLDAMPAALRNYRPNPTQSGDTWNASRWWLDEIE